MGRRNVLGRAFLVAGLLAAASCTSPGRADQVRRLSPKEAHEMSESKQALLVCAYDRSHCPGTHLAGFITLEELWARVSALRPDQEIIFFCGCAGEAAAAGRAAELEARGFRNVAVVRGGLLAWILEGYVVTSTGREQQR